MHDRLRSLVVEMVRSGVSLDTAKREFERLFLEELLAANDGNQSATARQLGIHRNTLSKKLEPVPTLLRLPSRAS